MLKRSILVSGLLHAAVITATSIIWVPTLAFPDDASHVVPIELVTIAEQTNVAPTVQRDRPPPAPQALAQVASLEPDFKVTPPEPVEVEVAPPEPEKPPEPPPPPPQVEEVKEPPPTPPPVAKLVLPRRKPAPPPKRQNFDVDSVLALLDKRSPRAPAPPTAKLADNTLKGIGSQNALSVDVKDALLSQMRACWNVPVGAPNPEQLIVQVRVFLSQDGRLAQPPQLEPATRNASLSNPYMRTAAEAALRAVNICEPYRSLPVEKYDSWREIVMTFDPSKMAGR